MLGPQPDMQRVAFEDVGVAVGLAEQGFRGADAQMVEDARTGELAAGDGQGQGGGFVGDDVFRTQQHIHGGAGGQVVLVAAGEFAQAGLHAVLVGDLATQEGPIAGKFRHKAIRRCMVDVVGKTTLVNKLKELKQFENYEFATERSEYLNNLGIPLNTDSTLKGQTVFLAERAAELINENIITDRTIIYPCRDSRN
jgi:hypothetical protein